MYTFASYFTLLILSLSDVSHSLETLKCSLHLTLYNKCTSGSEYAFISFNCVSIPSHSNTTEAIARYVQMCSLLLQALPYPRAFATNKSRAASACTIIITMIIMIEHNNNGLKAINHSFASCVPIQFVFLRSEVYRPIKLICLSSLW